MGTVWAATHTVTQQRHALKFLRPRAMGQRHRFLREARAACAVDHPNVVKVQDIFELDDGMPVMVMELLEGESLQALLHRRRQLDAAELAHIMLPVVSAVGTAHAAGIVHRDLKPENIFLVHPSPGGSATTQGTMVKVLDFGIAKLMPTELSVPAPGDTQTGALLGTPHYMSPEQAGGERVDHRSDIWSLGIIAYEALSGVLPTRADSVGGVLKIVMTARIPPLRDAGLTLPTEIIDLVDRMLAETPQNRPQDLREVRDVLLRHVSEQVPDFGAPVPERSLSDMHETAPAIESTVAMADTVQATPDVILQASSTTAGTAHTAAPALQRSPQRSSRVPWIALAVLGVALCGGTVLWLGMGRERGEASTSGSRSKKEVVPKLGLEAIATYRNRPAQRADLVHSASFWESAANDFEKSLESGSATPRRKAELRFARGMSKLHRGKLAKAAAAFQKAASYAPEWALPHDGLAHALVLLGQNDEALAAAREAERLDPKWWGGAAALGHVYAKMNRLDDAIEAYNRALVKSEGNVALLAALAHTYHAARNDSQAKHYAAEALKRNGRMTAPLIIMAELALEREDGGSALANADRALAKSPRDIAALLARADALALLKRHDDALAAYRKFLEVLDEFGAIGAPEDRVALVRQHLQENELPPSRTSVASDERSRSVKTPTRSRGPKPAPRSRPPRSRPTKPSPSPARSRPPDNVYF